MAGLSGDDLKATDARSVEGSLHDELKVMFNRDKEWCTRRSGGLLPPVSFADLFSARRIPNCSLERGAPHDV